MQRTKTYFLGRFRGDYKKFIKIERFSEREVIEEILEIVPEDDNGYLDLYEVDFYSNKKKLVKRFLIISELELYKTEEQAIYF